MFHLARIWIKIISGGKHVQICQDGDEFNQN